MYSTQKLSLGVYKRLLTRPRTIAVLLLTYLFTRLWLRSSESERFWTWLNSLLANGADPGLTSDVELITVLAVALAGAVIVVYLSLKLWQAVIKHGKS